MKKIVLVGIIATSLFTVSGEEVYKSRCMACHKIIDLQAQKQKMMALSPQERQKAKKEFMKKMMAPPMNKVSARIKHFYPEKEGFVAFVKDYIVNPAKDKALCQQPALQRFGVMPPIGKSLSKEQINAVAVWMYDNFDEKWKNAKSCAADGGKKGGKKKPAMKCGTGKCGAM